MNSNIINNIIIINIIIVNFNINYNKDINIKMLEVVF